MRYWLSHLPLEVWVDCYRYPWISREELGRIVDRFGNRKCVEYLQFYLHDWGKRKLKPIYFHQSPSKAIPLTPMPTNIRSFELIQIKHFDQQTIEFLRRIQPLLLVNIKLVFIGIESYNLDNLRIILDHVVPFLGEIDSLRCRMLALPTVQQCLSNEKLAKINWIEAYDQEYAGMDEAMRQTTINFLMTWLNPPAQQNGDNIVGPKWCEVNIFIDDGFSEQFCAAIRQDFLAAKSPSTFNLFVNPYHSQWQFVGFHLQNSIGEELHCVKLPRHNDFQITRHKANCGMELQEWIEKNKAKRSSGHLQNLLSIRSPTIGQIDAVNGPDDREENEEKPFTSKDI